MPLESGIHIIEVLDLEALAASSIVELLQWGRTHDSRTLDAGVFHTAATICPLVLEQRDLGEALYPSKSLPHLRAHSVPANSPPQRREEPVSVE